MTRTWAVRSLGIFVTLLAAWLLSPAAAGAQGQGQQITICHRTGSATAPWVFMSVDASTWPEHEAQGDIRANSLADCAPTAQAPAAPPAPAQAAPAAPPAPPQPAPAVQQAVPLTTQPGASTTQPASQPETQPAAVAQQRAEVAGAQAAAAEQEPPPVSSLPASGGEPDRPLLVVGLLSLLAVGAGLRRLGRAHA